MRGFVLTPTYRVVDGVPEVHLHGVLESGEACMIIDDRTRPYFFVRCADAERVSRVAPGRALEPTALRTFDGEPVMQVTLGVPGEAPPLRRRLEEGGVACFEADIRFAYRYLIDRGIRGAFDVHGHFTTQPRLGRVYRNPELRPTHWAPKLRVLSIDIETSIEGGQLYAIALHMRGYEHVILVHAGHFEHAECVHSEKAAVRRLLAYVEAMDPDVITGWNVVDFDLAFLAKVAHRHGVPFTLGRCGDPLELRRDPSFTRESRAVLGGRQVLDGLALTRGAFIRLDDYKLETAARTLLGKGKLIAGDDRHRQIEALYRDDPQALVEYNLQDARLVTEILEHTGLVNLAIERSLLTGMPLDRVSAAIASVDSLYLNALRERGVVAPSVRIEEPTAEISGGHVLESRPGLYANVLVFDFKSLYPSIIRTFNIDPLTWVRSAGADSEPALTAPNGARFRRGELGVLPELLTALAAARARAQRDRDAVKSNAIKILMNSFYGVLGATASRLFAPPVANAVTSFGQHLILFAADCVRRLGYRVLYGDTDSLFVEAGDTDPSRAASLGEMLRAAVGGAVAEHVRADYGCVSVLELEFEKMYHRFFLPEVRGGHVGSKKRYAGLLRDADGREEVEFVGLEAVRRDWTSLSKQFQLGLLQRVFHDEPLEAYVRTFVADLRAGRFDDQLVYRKAVRKQLGAYTKTTPPHVKAARKLGASAGRIVAYVMTTDGPEPIEKRTAPPDYDHYVEHQVAPIADAVLRFVGTDFAAVMQTRRQLNLF